MADVWTFAQRRELKEIFDWFDYDKSGSISKSEFQRALVEADCSHITADQLMKETDVNNDKKVTFEEFLDAAAHNKNIMNVDTSNFNFLIRYVNKAYVPKTDASLKGYLSKYKWIPPPIFILTITIVQIVLFSYYKEHTDCLGDPKHKGLECPRSFSTRLALRPQCRDQAWRFLTYALMHSGTAHIIGNIVIQVLIGFPMEVIHGPYRVAALYLLGALCGSLGSTVFDPTTNVVGASGAVYALMGAHVAHMIQNWGEIDYNVIRALFLGSLLIADLVNSLYQRYYIQNESVSYTGHFSGFLAGMTLGVYILKNLRVHPWEVVVKWTGLGCALVGIFFAIFWNVFYDFPNPRSNAMCDTNNFSD